MGQTFSVLLKKIKSSTLGHNEKGYRWVRARRFLKRKAIPRIKNSKKIKYVIRSQVSRSLNQ